MLQTLQQVISLLKNLSRNYKFQDDFKKEIYSQAIALEKIARKDLFNISPQKAITIYNNVRKFIISRKSEFELNYNFHASGILYHILKAMVNPLEA